MMGIAEWNTWLMTVPNEDVEGFEDAAHEWALQYAEASGDVTAGQCLTSFFGDNPREWLDEAFESITNNCKSQLEATALLTKLYEEVKVNVR